MSDKALSGRRGASASRPQKPSIVTRPSTDHECPGESLAAPAGAGQGADTFTRTIPQAGLSPVLAAYADPITLQALLSWLDAQLLEAVAVYRAPPLPLESLSQEVARLRPFIRHAEAVESAIRLVKEFQNGRH